MNNKYHTRLNKQQIKAEISIKNELLGSVNYELGILKTHLEKKEPILEFSITARDRKFTFTKTEILDNEVLYKEAINILTAIKIKTKLELQTLKNNLNQG